MYCFKVLTKILVLLSLIAIFRDDFTEEFYQKSRTNPDTDNDSFFGCFRSLGRFDPLTDDSKVAGSKDGLTNYENLKIYPTSIFPADIDRNGLKNKTKIRIGTNPLKWDNWAFLFGLYFLYLYGGILANVIFLVKFKLKKPNKGAS